ncbi:MAG TPA: non-homologous end-joining DNA ligase, partial [bacterium]|nr:non-homologous end-joining DNA ligase [bacterium]
REGIGALVLGVYDDNKLHYIGHTGTGFDTKESIRLKNLLDKIMTNDSPFEPVPKTNSKVTWVEPKEVAEISFTEWTPDGKMRHPVYLGLREDKNPKEVCLDDVQIPIEGSDPKSIPISHREKIFWPEENYTKGDMIDYYEAISGTMLPYLRDRPMVMNRFPNGIKGLSFYQKNVKEKDLPPFVEIKEIISSSGKKTNYILGNNRETLLYMANLASIEINPWNSRIQHLEQPDYFVIDLDPLDVSFELVVEIAQIVKEILKLAHLEGYCKTSGATGLHIYVPLNAKYSYETVRSFAHVIADLVSKRCLKWASTERSPAKRAGKVYVDYLQNAFGQTLVAPYSLRPRPGAPVSTPLDWSEVNSSLKVLDYNMTTVPKRIKDKGDIWKPILECQNDLQEAFTQLEKISS